MAGRRILVTGVATDLGSRLVRRLVEDPRVEFVGGMDVQEPAADLGGASSSRPAPTPWCTCRSRRCPSTPAVAPA
jgi:nucleoside-diphosphate-sugar epimerase